MSIFDKFRRKTNTEVRQFFPFTSETFGTALFPAEKNLAVDRAVSLISSTIATLPLNLYVHTKGGLVEAWGHPVSKLLKDPAVEETSVLFFKTIIRHLLLCGDAYIFKHKYQDEVVSLEIIDPSLVFVQRSESGRKLYNISASKKGVYTESDVIQICYYDEGYGGSTGMSPVQVHKREILMNDYISEYISLFFQRGIGSRLLVELDKDQYQAGSPKLDKLIQEFATYFNKFVVGRDNWHRPVIAPAGTKLSLLEPGNNEHARTLELYEKSCADIYRMFNVPAEIIDSKDSKYNSLSQKQQDFYNNTIHPLCKHISETLEKGLLKPEERGRYTIAFDYNGLLEADYEKKVDLWIKRYHSGICTLNELRDALSMSRVENEVEGDTRWLPANLIPATADNIEAMLARSKLALKELKEGKESPSEANVVNKSAEKVEENQLNHNGTQKDMNI